MRPKCEHGGPTDRPFIGQWNGPIGTCECCGDRFVYCDVGSSNGYAKFWSPKDRCAVCGGHYIEHHGATKETP